MSDDTVLKLSQPSTFSDPLTEVLRSGARSLLARAVEAEVAAFLDGHSEARTEEGRRRLVRHGHLPEREIMTGIGPIAVRAPRDRDRTGLGADRIRFRSAHHAGAYARCSQSLEVLIPVLYLEGISTGDFAEALADLLGPDAGGLSASTVARHHRGLGERARALASTSRICRPGTMSTSGPTASMCRPGSRTICNACWSSSGSTQEGKKRTRRPHGRGARERPIVARAATSAPQTEQACSRARTRHRGRRARLLEGERGSVAPDPRPALLGAQDRQRAQQAAQEPALEVKACSPGALDGRYQ